MERALLPGPGPWSVNLQGKRWTMRYDDGYGRHGGWELRMEHGDHGYDRGYPDPRQGRGGPTERPWVGGYEPGYQGGSEGISLRTTGPLYSDAGYGRDFGGHERGYRRPRGARPVDNRGTVRMRASGRELDPRFGRGEHGDTFAYTGDRGGTGFGGRGGRQGGPVRGGYGRDFGGGYGRGFRGGYGREYDRGMRGYAREFQNQGRPEEYRPRDSPGGGTYAPLEGSYLAGRLPRPPRDARWTRWF